MWYLTWMRKKREKEWSIVYITIVAIILVWEYILQHPILILYIAWFLILLFFWYLTIQYKRAKDKEKPASLWKDFETKYPIIIQYTPPKWINPAEAWLLYNCNVDVTDLTSLIYQRTLDWILSIKNISWKDSNHIEKIELVKLKNIPSNRPFFERDIFDSIFLAWDQKTITYSFQLKYALLLEDLEIHGINKWRIYRPTSAKIWKIVYSILVLLLVVSFVMIFWWSNLEWHLDWFYISVILIFACIFLWWYIFGWKPLKLTDKWAELASHLIWYRNFIKSCDENKIRLFLKEDPLFVDKTLPYATAFWIETEFIKKISPMKNDFYGKGAWLYEKNGNLSSLILYLLKN